jgi:hypothetical protein
MYFVFAMIWAFGGALVEKDGINYRRWVAGGGQLARRCIILRPAMLTRLPLDVPSLPAALLRPQEL